MLNKKTMEKILLIDLVTHLWVPTQCYGRQFCSIDFLELVLLAQNVYTIKEFDSGV